MPVIPGAGGGGSGSTIVSPTSVIGDMPRGRYTMGDIMAQIVKWLREPEDDDLLIEAVNDAIESRWESLMLYQISQFIKGPVQITIPSGAERLQLISIPDPSSGPVVTGVNPGGTLPAATLQFAFTYVTESGSETNLSPLTAFTRNAGFQAQVSSPAFQSGVFGWNVYAGDTQSRLTKQNEDPLNFASAWLEPPDVGVSDLPDFPEPPTSNTTADDISYILHMEMTNPSQTWQAFNQADLDSTLMRLTGKSLASASVYQNYCFDLINGNTVELRPAAGLTITPRYFFVKKPRRIRFKEAALPFQIDGMVAYLRYHAIAAVKLSVDEYTAAEAWDAKADKAKGDIILAFAKQNSPKNKRVIPYMS